MPELVEHSRERLWWFCPGCQAPHAVPVDGPNAWTWDRSTEKPTLSPSILCRWTEGEAHTPKACHSWMRAGRLEFLADSTHALAGQTVPIDPWTAWGEFR